MLSLLFGKFSEDWASFIPPSGHTATHPHDKAIIKVSHYYGAFGGGGAVKFCVSDFEKRRKEKVLSHLEMT